MVLKFGNFEFSRSGQRLARDGRPVRLTGQPLKLLNLLLEEPGRLVTREEIRTRLWPDITVDFDHSLDVALSRLRTTLGERAKEAVFIETVPRVGVRFIAGVQVQAATPAAPRVRPLAVRVGLYALTAIVAAMIA